MLFDTFTNFCRLTWKPELRLLRDMVQYGLICSGTKIHTLIQPTICFELTLKYESAQIKNFSILYYETRLTK